MNETSLMILDLKNEILSLRRDVAMLQAIILGKIGDSHADGESGFNKINSGIDSFTNIKGRHPRKQHIEEPQLDPGHNEVDQQNNGV